MACGLATEEGGREVTPANLQFLAYLAQRKEEDRRKKSALRALKVHQTHVENLCAVVMPGLAWTGAIVALIFMWSALDAHRLVWIVVGHVAFRLLARVWMNAFLIPRMLRGLVARFPEFALEFEEVMKEDPP